jgi:hypothetical protein
LQRHLQVHFRDDDPWETVGLVVRGLTTRSGMAIDGQLTILPAGNVAAIFICGGAIWLIRASQKGRL